MGVNLLHAVLKQMRDQITWKALYRRAVAVKAICLAEAPANASLRTGLVLHAVFESKREK